MPALALVDVDGECGIFAARRITGQQPLTTPDDDELPEWLQIAVALQMAIHGGGSLYVVLPEPSQ